jgi:hypothetical protein
MKLAEKVIGLLRESSKNEDQYLVLPVKKDNEGLSSFISYLRTAGFDSPFRKLGFSFESYHSTEGNLVFLCRHKTTLSEAKKKLKALKPSDLAFLEIQKAKIITEDAITLPTSIAKEDERTRRKKALRDGDE